MAPYQRIDQKENPKGGYLVIEEGKNGGRPNKSMIGPYPSRERKKIVAELCNRGGN